MNINYFLLGISLFFSIHSFAHKNEKCGEGTSIDSLNASNLNWYNLDLEEDKIVGVSVQKVYLELLNEKTSGKKIIVAVIDGGVDIHHEDLQGKIWINADEIPENGIDDDKNGFIDDIHGWNFLGNAQGENIDVENYEYVRIINKYSYLYDSNVVVESLSKDEIVEYNLYLTCKEHYHKELAKYTLQKESIEAFKSKLIDNITILEPYTHALKPEKNDLAPIKPKNSEEKHALKFLNTILNRGFTYDMLDEILERNEQFLTMHLNLNLNARELIGDNIEDIEDLSYGNNQVNGPGSDHGTFVSGIIAANRNNDLGIIGIVENVEIMVLRAVPDGDEYDKDIALSIRYAVDNGANIINMSFGKDYSPQKSMVDAAIKYAEDKGVLLIHAAGNDGEDNDKKPPYPDKKLNDGTHVTNWITVGANSLKNDKYLPGEFSNYGNVTVDLFAPGVDIISLYAGSKYELASGTSFSSPVVTGVAALVWSYYPELTATQLKEVLLESANVLNRRVVQPNTISNKKTKVKFSELSVTGGIVNAYNAIKLADKKLQGISKNVN
jgi:subtilisin family serine protease